MKSVSKMKNVKMGDKKLKLPASYIRRSKNLSHALILLKMYNEKKSKAFGLIGAAVQSARANLISELNKVNKELNENDCKVDVQIGNGNKDTKRYSPRAKGKADVICKRTSHIMVTISEVLNGQ